MAEQTPQKRELSTWETVICTALEPLGFRYWPHEKGSGYWFDNVRGLQLTNDLQFHQRGCRQVWTLKRIDGLKVWTITMSDRKRTPRTTAEDIVKRLAFLSRDDWRESERWGRCEDFSS